MYLPVTEIQHFSTHDGDGIRTVVFLKGCPLRCQWCHNPETQNTSNELFYIEQNCILCGGCVSACPNECHSIEQQHEFNRGRCTRCMACAKVCPSKALLPVSKTMAVDEIVAEVMKDAAFYSYNGGVTLSGGEPLTHPNECIELLSKLKAQGVNTAIETCGYFDSQYARDIAKVTDTFLFDLKDSDNERHIKYTGVSNEKILQNLYLLDSLGKEIILRCIMLKGINMEENHINRIAQIYHSLKHCKRVDLIPHHPYGNSKYARLGLRQKLQIDLTPDRETLIKIKDCLIGQQIPVALL